jgi:hypothetical protein
MHKPNSSRSRFLLHLVLLAAFACSPYAQKPVAEKVRLGSETAKNGFRNETEIAAKFNNWKTDEDARSWLAAMDLSVADIESVRAVKPHGEKSDVQLAVKTNRGEFSIGISIKLVSSEKGYNQIDKRWLSHYVKMWNMPRGVEASLSLFLGETAPKTGSRDANRMFLDELEAEARKDLIEFFTDHKSDIVSDLFEGDGAYRANWLMVALRSGETPKWAVRRMDKAISFFSEGKVGLTARGNLRIGRITMQRKGGDGGRETAKMLQFKINPAEIFELK